MENIKKVFTWWKRECYNEKIRPFMTTLLLNDVQKWILEIQLAS